MIIVNFKNYQESFGNGALELAKICKKVSEKSKVKIIHLVSALDAALIKEKLEMEVWLQSVDPILEGRGNGFISPLKAQKMGIDGSLLNHSEHRFKTGTVKKMLKSWPKGFKSMLCISSFGQIQSWAGKVKSDYVAYEVKSLIASKDKSIISEKAEVIKKIVDFYKKKKIGVLVGSGIKSEKDVKEALKLGAKGVLASSAIVKAKDPEKVLTKFVAVFGV